MTQKSVRCLALIAYLLGACSVFQRPQPAATAAPSQDLAARQRRVLEELRTILEESYLYAGSEDVDLAAGIESIRSRVAAGLTDEDFYLALEAFVGSLPEDSASFLTREARIAAELEEETTYEGIGAFVAVRAEPTPRMLLLSVMEGSPAEQAGLRAHDAVYVIDGDPVQAEEGLEVVKRVRGLEGTEVVLEVRSPGEPRREVRVKRGQVTVQSTFRAGFLLGNVLYLQAPVSGDETIANAFTELLQTAEEQELDLAGVVFDLRIASSSGDWPLNELLALFGDGELGSFKGRDEISPLTVAGQDLAGSQSLPLVVIVGPDTTGAAEVFAAALQAVGRATMVGLPTPGNVLSFEQRVLSEGSLVTFAVSSFESVRGVDLSFEGVRPDVVVEADWDEVTQESDPVIVTALRLLSER